MNDTYIQTEATHTMAHDEMCHMRSSLWSILTLACPLHTSCKYTSPPNLHNSTHTHILSLSLTHTHTLSLSLSLSLSHTFRNAYGLRACALTFHLCSWISSWSFFLREKTAKQSIKDTSFHALYYCKLQNNKFASQKRQFMWIFSFRSVMNFSFWKQQKSVTNASCHALWNFGLQTKGNGKNAKR